MKKYLKIITALLLCAVFIACDGEGTSLTGTVELTYADVDGVEGITSYIVEMTDEDGEKIVRKTTEKTMTIEKVPVGKWTVAVSGVNDEGTYLSSSFSDVTVLRNTVALSSLSLRGSAEIKLSVKRAPERLSYYVLIISYGENGLRSFSIDKGNLASTPISVPASTELTYTLYAYNAEGAPLSASVRQKFSYIGTSDTLTFDLQEYNYRVGDTGPAGGVIFFVNSDYVRDGWKYLEADSGDFTTRLCFGYNAGLAEKGRDSKSTCGTDRKENKAIGKGKENTDMLTSRMGDKTVIRKDRTTMGEYAAKAVSSYMTDDGFSGWFLPSEDEAELMFLHRDILDLDPHACYYTSNECDTLTSWVLDMPSALDYGHVSFSRYSRENAAGAIRAIRRF